MGRNYSHRCVPSAEVHRLRAGGVRCADGVVDDLNPNGRPRLDAADLAMLRVRRFTQHRIRPAVHGDRAPVTVRSWTVGGEPVPFAHAVQQDFRPFAVGEAWGRPWDTV